MTKAAIYYRAYPQEAQNEEHVLEQRKQTCVAYAAEHGYEINGRLCSDSINKVGLNRLGLQKLWLLITRREIEALLITDLLQLSNDPAQLVSILADLKDANIAIVTVADPTLKLDELTLHLAPITNRDAEMLSLAQYVEVTRALRRPQPSLQGQAQE